MASAGPDPQSLKSWQDAFQYPIPTVRHLEQELRRDIASNKERLRALVGTRYRDLVGTAETIVLMNREIQEVDSTLADIGRRCNRRLIERMHAHMNQIKDDSQDKGKKLALSGFAVQGIDSSAETERRALGAQLSLLHRCTQAIAYLLRKRGSTLLMAKLLVLSRLLHKTLSQQETIPPFLDNLRNQLASLRRTLLKRIDKRLASAKSTVDDTIESLAAYCLATSSSSDDAIRHFHHVRLDVIGNLLGLTELSGENVPNALQLYIQTLQVSKTLLSRRLSDALNKLKAKPILADPDILRLDELSIDVLGRWVAADVKNFTPWIKLSELSKPEAEKTIKQWSRQAFDAFVKGCSHILTDWYSFSELLALRRKTLELWLSSWGSTPTHSSMNVLEGIRSAFNERLSQILSDQAKELEQFGQAVSSVVTNWDTNEHVETLSLWDDELINLDFSDGAAAFKQTIADRLLGRDADVSTVLAKYETWLAAIGKAKEYINEMKRVRWTDILEEGEEEDADMDIPAILNDDDTALLKDALQQSVRESFNYLQSAFAEILNSFGSSHRDKKAAFLLKLIRLVRKDLPVDFISSDFAFSKEIVPQLQEILTARVVTLTEPSNIWPKRASQTNKILPGRSLWEGDPELPVQPSPAIFKFLRRLVDTMDHYGLGLWDVSTTQALKEGLRKELWATAAATLKKASESVHDQEESAASKEAQTVENGDNDKIQQLEADAAITAQNTDDYKIQLYLDLVYLSNALSTTEPAQDSLSDAVDSLSSSLNSNVKTVKILEQRAHDYWKRTHLLTFTNWQRPKLSLSRGFFTAHVTFRPATNFAAGKLECLLANFLPLTCEPSTYRTIRSPSHNRAFHASRYRAQEAYHRRYGPAAEANLPPPSKPKEELSKEQESKTPAAKDGNHQLEQSRSQDGTKRDVLDASHEKDNDPKTAQPRESQSSNESHLEEESEPDLDAPDIHAVSPVPTERPSQDGHKPNSLNDNPLEGVLHMPSPASPLTPTETSPSANKPHLTPAPYVHHFDTYSLVCDLSKGGFTEEQSITIMKAIRTILHNNLDIARQSLTSKSDVENETYLFKAACSELQSSLQTARNSEMQRQRASRAQLEHEADILSQRLNQELAGLKDDIKGMFNDHKMTTREQQRSIDTSVQELNYKITVSLNSDGKSEIEGLRWILTRRAAMAVATSAFMIIIFLKYYSVRKAQEAAEKKKETPAKETTEKRVAQEAAPPPTLPAVPEIIISESLG
ncbi:hypothetical protein CNMCM6457_008564 [Aspergillus fumigatiaffinis]|nr:hypothetical protein CNMCM6457_008564 [Aspergillus fumigatiaffinis]